MFRYDIVKSYNVLTLNLLMLKQWKTKVKRAVVKENFQLKNYFFS